MTLNYMTGLDYWWWRHRIFMDVWMGIKETTNVICILITISNNLKTSYANVSNQFNVEENLSHMFADKYQLFIALCLLFVSLFEPSFFFKFYQIDKFVQFLKELDLSVSFSVWRYNLINFYENYFFRLFNVFLIFSN